MERDLFKEIAMTVANPAPAQASVAPLESQSAQIHPLIHAGRWLLADMLSTLIFVGVYAVTHSIYVATGLGVAAGLVQVAYLKARRAPIDLMQWMSLGLVIVFGGASLLTHDPRFIMLKPTLIYAAIGAVMLKRGWMVRYMPPIALPWSADVSTAFGYGWAGLMFVTAALNVALVAHGDPKLWAWWIGVFPLASKVVLFAVQYVTTRLVVRRRIFASMATAAAI
jgi:intracellular septation protein A